MTFFIFFFFWVLVYFFFFWTTANNFIIIYVSRPRVYTLTSYTWDNGSYGNETTFFNAFTTACQLLLMAGILKIIDVNNSWSKWWSADPRFVLTTIQIVRFYSTASNTIAGPFFGNDILSNISANVFVRLLMMAVGVDWDYWLCWSNDDILMLIELVVVFEMCDELPFEYRIIEMVIDCLVEIVFLGEEVRFDDLEVPWLERVYKEYNSFYTEVYG